MANILFALEPDRIGQAEGVRAFSVHPGTPILDPLQQLKTVEQGASTSVWYATNPRLNGMGGVYCENNDIASVLTTVGDGIPVYFFREENRMTVQTDKPAEASGHFVLGG